VRKRGVAGAQAKYGASAEEGCLGWRSLFSRRKQSKQPLVLELAKLSTSEAMFNRAALNPATLRIYCRMVKEGGGDLPTKQGISVFGALNAVIVKQFAQEAGKPVPDSPQAAADFLRSELKGFDTEAARERRESAVAAELMRNLKGDTSMKDFDAALDEFVAAAVRRASKK
jgi:hypothetical protein